MRILSFKTAIVCASLLVCACMFSEDSNPEWMDNFEDVKSAATKENKYILADFTGSAWCPWCMKLEKKVFGTPEFKKYAKENLILFIADFPRNKAQSAGVKKQNEELIKKYDVMGFPTVLLLTSEGDTIFTTGYQDGGPKPYVESLKKAITEKFAKKIDKKASLSIKPVAEKPANHKNKTSLTVKSITETTKANN